VTERELAIATAVYRAACTEWAYLVRMYAGKDALAEMEKDNSAAVDLSSVISGVGGAPDASDERAKVVAWLRAEETRLRGEVRTYAYSGPDPFEFKAEAAEFFADAIERGEHDK